MTAYPPPPDYNTPPTDPYAAAAAPRRRFPVWLIVLLSSLAAGLLVIVLLVVLSVGWLFYVGVKGPETSIYVSNQVPKNFQTTLKDLKLLDPGERIRYFYSDALVDIEQGMYVLTDRRLILYSQDWEPHAATIAFDQIADVDASWSDSWLDDSLVTVELKDGEIWSFPLSMENDTDHQMVDDLCKSAGLPLLSTPNP